MTRREGGPGPRESGVSGGPRQPLSQGAPGPHRFQAPGFPGPRARAQPQQHALQSPGESELLADLIPTEPGHEPPLPHPQPSPAGPASKQQPEEFEKKIIVEDNTENMGRQRAVWGNVLAALVVGKEVVHHVYKESLQINKKKIVQDQRAVS